MSYGNLNLVSNSAYRNAQKVINGDTLGMGACIVKYYEHKQIIHYPGERSTEEIKHIYPFSHRFITEAITLPNMRQLYRWNLAMFIDAQTGSGKTTFVFEVCYPIVRERGQKLLILSNRKIIKNKIKYDAIKAACPEMLELKTAKGIEQEHHFADIDVYTYQDFFGDFNYHLNRKEFEDSLKDYGMVIFDEIHFAVSDAGFNPYTFEIMEYLFFHIMGKEVPRVYMTGTPEYVFDYVYHQECRYSQKNWWRQEYGNGLSHFYYCNFQRDYTYLDVISFENDAEIIKLINESKEKWVIFLNDIEKAEQMESMIIERSTVVLSSGGMKIDSNKAIVESIVEKDSMGNLDVLFTTTVLDVGINIKDQVNIVSYLKERSSFIQAIGRKRVRKKEKVRLFLPQYSAQDIRKWIYQNEKELEMLRENESKFEPETKLDGIIMPDHFYARKGCIKSNRLSFTYYQSVLDDWQETLQNLDDKPDKIASNIIFAHFLSWLGKPMKEEVEESKRELVAIIEKYRCQNMEEDEFKSLCEELKPFDKRKDTRKSREQLSVQSVNKILEDCGLVIDHDHKAKKYKIVERREKNNG